MQIPWGFDEANRKDRYDRRLEKGKQLANRVATFINDVNRDQMFSDKQKRRIVDTILDKIFKD